MNTAVNSTPEIVGMILKYAEGGRRFKVMSAKPCGRTREECGCKCLTKCLRANLRELLPPPRQGDLFHDICMDSSIWRFEE